MITRSISVTKGIWQTYNIEIGTELSDTVEVLPNTLYPVEVFYNKQQTNYTPRTVTSGVIYSGNIYLGSSVETADIVDYVRDQLQYNLFPSNNTILQRYYMNTNHFEAPLFAGPKPQWYTNNIFYIYVTDETTNSTLEIELVMYPSYESEAEILTMGDLSDPILDIISPQQLFFTTSATTSPSSQYVYKYFTLYSSTGQSTTISKYINNEMLATHRGITTSFFDVTSLIHETSLDDCVKLSYSRWGGTSQKTSTYKVDYCLKYVLYYRNLKGGWDWLPVRGSVIKSYKFKKSTYSNDYLLGTNKYFNVNTNAGINRISVNVNNVHNDITYQNNITQELKINLGWFTDEQSEKMMNLFSSPIVYIHILNEANLLPIKITDTSLTEKKYKDNKSISKYTLKAEINQKYIIQ